MSNFNPLQPWGFQGPPAYYYAPISYYPAPFSWDTTQYEQENYLPTAQDELRSTEEEHSSSSNEFVYTDADYSQFNAFEGEAIRNPDPPGPGPGPWGPGPGPGPWGPGPGPGPWGPGPGPWGPGPGPWGPGPGPWGPGPGPWGPGPGPWGPGPGPWGPGPGPWGPGPLGPLGPLGPILPLPLPIVGGGPRPTHPMTTGGQFIYISVQGGPAYPNATATYQLQYQPGITIYNALTSTGVIQLSPSGQVLTVSGVTINENVQYSLRLNGQNVPANMMNHILQPNDKISIDLVYS